MAAELAALGCNEIMSNSLESESLYNHHDDATKNELVKVLNPLSSELNIMRRSGVYSGLEAIRFNANRQQKRLQLFEFGFTYAKQEDGYEERPYLGIFISGERQPENWGMAAAKSDFFTLKGLVSHVLTKAGVKVDKLRESVNASPYGKETLSLGLGKSVLADIVQVDKKLASKLEIDQPVYAAIIYWDTLIQMTGKPNKFTPLPKFPAVRRDLALLVGEQVSYLDIQQVVKKFTGEQMRGVNLFDVYTGKNLPEGKKSYAISVTFRDDNATLTDKKVDKVMAKVIAGLQNEVGAELR